MSERDYSQPTGDQCNENAVLHEDENSIVFACWYPQMGGYASKAIVEATKEACSSNDCFDVHIWHDGDWPFHDGQNPDKIHHCSANQFINFGKLVLEKQGGVYDETD